MSGVYEYDVFLSYSSTDVRKIKRLAERLRCDGLKVWFDEWVIRPGDDILGRIERGLEKSRTQILCLSSAALGSDWVRLERNTALFRDPMNEDRRFIPILIDDCLAMIPDTLRRYQYIDLRRVGKNAYRRLLDACRDEARGSADPSTIARTVQALTEDAEPGCGPTASEQDEGDLDGSSSEGARPPKSTGGGAMSVLSRRSDEVCRDLQTKGTPVRIEEVAPGIPSFVSTRRDDTADSPDESADTSQFGNETGRSSLEGALAGKTILVVDDDPDVLDAITTSLSDTRATILCASDGNAALDVAKEASPDLLILDLMLPQKGGFLVLAQLRKGKRRGDKPRVIIITGNQGRRHREYAEGLGVDGYYNKPFRMELLVEATIRLLSEESPSAG